MCVSLFFKSLLPACYLLLTWTGMKSGNKSLLRWLLDRRNATTILPCATREGMIRRKDRPKRPGQASRESPLGRVKRNRTARASRAICRRLYVPIAYELNYVRLSGARSHVPNSIALPVKNLNYYWVMK